MKKYKVLRTRKILPVPSFWNGFYQTAPTTKKILGECIRRMWIYYEDGLLTQFYLEDKWEKCENYFATKVSEDRNYLEKIYANQFRMGKKIEKMANEILKLSLKNQSVEQLYDQYAKIEKMHFEYNQINVLPWFMGADEVHLRVLKEICQKNPPFSEEEFLILTNPVKKTFSSEEEYDILKIFLGKLSSSQIKSEIQSLVDKFYWIPFGYDGPKFYDENHYRKILKSLKEKDRVELEKRYELLKNYEKNLELKQSTIQKNFNISQDILDKIEKIRILTLMTDERKEITFRLFVPFDKILHELARRLKAKWIDLKYVTHEELKTNPDWKRLAKERQSQPIVFVFLDGKYELILGDEAKKIFEQAVGKLGAKTTIKGSIGSKGVNSVVQGKVRIMFSPDEIEKLLPGEILVSTMTTPEYVPAMRKSLAVITDEGGITCHAAIVSRELGIPCIIATKIATKILKDGDLVEVDANNGIVRILKGSNGK